MKNIIVTTQYTQEIVVEESMLAKNVGSGIVNVYATPMMIAFMENTAVKCLEPFMEDGETSVGVQMNTSHDAATPVGMKVCVTATITAVDRKKISFEIIAKDEKDTIGKATHERFIVNKAKFEQKAQAKGKRDE